MGNKSFKNPTSKQTITSQCLCVAFIESDLFCLETEITTQDKITKFLYDIFPADDNERHNRKINKNDISVPLCGSDLAVMMILAAGLEQH